MKNIHFSRWFSLRKVLCLSAVVLYTLPFSLPMLSSFFSGDDLMNLHYYTTRPFWQAIVSNLLFWQTYWRPLGGLLYLSLYSLFDLDPTAYYLAGFLIYSINVGLLFTFSSRLTGSVYQASAITGLASVHGCISAVWYNFGAIYELLSFGLMLVSLHCYLSFSSAPSRLADCLA